MCIRDRTNPVVRSEVLSPNTEDTVVSPAPMSNVPLSEPVPSVTVYSPSAVPVNHRKQAGEKTDSEAIPFTEPGVREESDGALEEQKSEAVCEDFPLDKEDPNQSSIAETPISAEEGFSISDGTQDETICSLNFTEKPTSEDTEETSPQPPCE